MSSQYIATIGLEIHVQLKTQTKLFSYSLNDSSEKSPNSNVSPVDLAHPGTLPVLNKEAVKHVLKVGLSLGSQLADYTEWDRKNYFYPDIPKAYQISQYKHPLVTGGSLSGVDITRVHLEEDTGRSIHDQGDYSLVDFNRAGMPLMELVTEPVIRTAEQAGTFARELQLLLRALGVSDANMEKGEMRVEANISISKSEAFGTKVEVKNLNSFKAMEKSISYEIARQAEVLENGGVVVQETRGWDDDSNSTFSQRSKEDAHDYRYFPDPDIPKLWISEIPEFSEERLRSEMPELPYETRNLLNTTYNLKSDSVEVLVQDQIMRERFILSAHMLPAVLNTSDLAGDVEMVLARAYQILANYIISDVKGLEFSEAEGLISNISSESLAELVALVVTEKLSSRGAKDVLLELYCNGGSALSIATDKNLMQQSNESTLLPIVEQVMSEFPHVVDEIRLGKVQGLQFLVGQAMKLSKGSGNPELLRKMVEDKVYNRF